MLYKTRGAACWLMAGTLVIAGLPTVNLKAQAPPLPKLPDDVSFRRADITSEGTRMAAEVFVPKTPKSDKLPTIVIRASAH